LMLEVLIRAQNLGLPMIKAQVLFTPGADISGNGDSGFANGDRDVATTSLSVRLINTFYLGKASPMDSLVSPLYATYAASFPPSVITTGTRDYLLSNGVRLFWKLRDAGVETQLFVSEGMWHGYNWEIDLPEAVRVRSAAMGFLNAQLAK
jgi:epsilon-lactone hydrolase